VARLNRQAGYTVLKEADAEAFVDRFLRERPDPALLAELRALVAPLRLSSSDEADNEALRSSQLASFLHIAARFEILDSLEHRSRR
jgi:hypothetical protein